ncbi:CCAAT-binding factor [Wuchereria bancrofti]|uniref:Nuclear transcription factor Y subunit beta n=1 Tax=Wuchereria bancrofti TaxID=6293 RepID=J9FMI1_WUCBA|nr:CCAAT-binding factor [Wuchereria bancrofti]
MINEGDGNNYLSKYPQDGGTCRGENSSTADSNVERILSDANNAQEEIIMTRKPILEQDRFLPIANISRLMKNVIPRSGKVAKDAKECVQECVSEFISFITSEACDRCLNASEKRKTITGEDIIGAFATLGFDNYVEPLNAYVRKFREAFRTDRSSTETLLVESSGPHVSFTQKINVRESNESTSGVFTIQNEPVPSSSACAPQIIFAGEEDPDGSIRVMSTGNVQHLQLLMDPATGQHYINVQNPNGTQQLLPVQTPILQVTTVADSSATPLTLACPEVQNLMDGKTTDKEMLDFSTKTEFPSLSKSENIASTSYKELSCSIKSGTTYGLKHSSSGLSTENQHKQQVSYVGNVGSFGHHQSNSDTADSSNREPPRKRSHESIDYISF